MGFSCMNGRLRRLPTTIASHRTPQNDDNGEGVNIRNSNRFYASAQSTISVIPFTLPDGIITTHQIPPSVVCKKKGGDHNHGCEGALNSSCNEKQYEHTETSFMLYHLKHIHRIKGELIVDHCWSIINCSSSNEGDDDHNKMEKNCPWLVLAVLTRLGKGHRSEGGERNTHFRKSEGNQGPICTVFLYGRPYYEMGNGEQSNPNMFDNCSIDCQGEDYAHKAAMQSLFSLSYRIDLSYFVNCIAMDSNILVIGSYSGATIYDIQSIMSKAKANNNENVQSSDDYFQNNDNDEEMRPSLHIMKSCIVQAMCISYPYFAAASGDRIGVWKIDDIVEHLHDQRIDLKSDDKEQIICARSSKRLTAIWNTKVDSNQSRITCIGMTEGKNAGDILAISCWDGSAFVFERETNNHYDGDRSSRQRTSWARVKPIESSFSEAVGDDIRANLRSWEDPIIDSDIVFPTFFALSSINNGAETRRLISISCPGHKIARCYDIDARAWLKDVGSPQYHSKDISHQVHGMISINSSFTNAEQKQKCKLLWIDNYDMINECIL